MIRKKIILLFRRMEDTGKDNDKATLKDIEHIPRPDTDNDDDNGNNTPGIETEAKGGEGRSLSKPDSLSRVKSMPVYRATSTSRVSPSKVVQGGVAKGSARWMADDAHCLQSSLQSLSRRRAISIFTRTTWQHTNGTFLRRC